MKKSLALVVLAATVGTATASPRAVMIGSLMPPGYIVLGSARMTAGRPVRSFEIVALGRTDEAARTRGGNAPDRPLLIVERKAGRMVLVGRNDDVVLRADEGEQCDPFLDGDATIAVKGRYFTVENGVACGQHWTDYITFRLDDRAGFVFDSQRTETWTLNGSDDPRADALVRDGPARVRRDPPGRMTAFARWRPGR